MTAIFISHSSADRVAAEDMKRWLEAQGHTSLFLDFDVESGIKAGADWEQTLYQKLRQCQAVIALLTPDWIASKWCFAELVQARERGKAIFLVKVQPCDARGIFADIQHIDLTTQPEEGYRRLKAGLLERGLDPLDVFDWDPKRPPYPGFMAFQEADAAIFFGRGLDIVKTLETLDALRRQGREAPPLVLLLGASGSGKSSLARAGVIPRLRKQPAQWLPVPPFRPQLEPLDELAMSLAAAFQALERRARLGIDSSRARPGGDAAAGRRPGAGEPCPRSCAGRRTARSHRAADHRPGGGTVRLHRLRTGDAVSSAAAGRAGDGGPPVDGDRHPALRLPRRLPESSGAAGQRLSAPFPLSGRPGGSDAASAASPKSSRVRRSWPGCSSPMGWSRPWWPTPAPAMRCPCWPSRCVACMSASAATVA